MSERKLFLWGLFAITMYSSLAQESVLLPEPEPIYSSTSDTVVSSTPVANPTTPPSIPSIDSLLNKYYVSLTVVVESGSRQCFHYEAGGDFLVEYEVLKGAHYDVGLTIEDQDGSLIAKHAPGSHAEVDVTVPSSMVNKEYRICVDNRKASSGIKHVFMSISLTTAARRIFVKNLSQREYSTSNELEGLDITMETFYVTMDNIDYSLQQVTHQQTRFRNTESVDRSVMEANFERVNLWSAFQLVVMITLSLVQVFMIRSLFYDPRRGGNMQKLWTFTDTVFSRWFKAAQSTSHHGRC